MNMNAEDLARMNKVLRHRLRNFASGIKSAVSMLSKELEDVAAPDLMEYFPLMTRECDDLAELTNRFNFLFDNPPDGGVEKIEFLLESLLEWVRCEFPNAEIDLRVDSISGSVRTSEAVKISLMEIVRNALESASNKIVILSCVDNGLSFCVEITSFGGQPDDCDQVFLPFFTTKSRHVGIGLAVARRLVSSSGGVVSAKKIDDKGFAVQVTLPKEK